MALFVGRLSIQKGPDLLLEAIPGALNSRHDAKFLFVGDGYMRGDLEHGPTSWAWPMRSDFWGPW